MHTALLALFLLCQNAPAAGASEPPTPVPAQPRAAVDESLERDLAILRRLDLPYDAPRAHRDATAGSIVAAIRKELSLQIEVDRRSIGDSGGWEEKRVTCDAATPRAALDAVLRAIQMGYDTYRLDVAAGIVVFTDMSGMRSLRRTKVYDLSGLAARAGARGADARQTMLEGLAESIQQVEDEELWENLGGDAASLTYDAGEIVVSASPALHHAIERHLAQLDAILPPAQVLWTFTVAEVPAEADPSRIDAIVSTGDARDIEAAGARILAQPTILAALGQQASIQIGGADDMLEVTVQPAAGDEPRAFLIGCSRSKAGARTAGFRIGARYQQVAAAFVEGGGQRLVVIAMSKDPDERPAPPPRGGGD